MPLGLPQFGLRCSEALDLISSDEELQVLKFMHCKTVIELCDLYNKHAHVQYMRDLAINKQKQTRSLARSFTYETEDHDCFGARTLDVDMITKLTLSLSSDIQAISNISYPKNSEFYNMYTRYIYAREYKSRSRIRVDCDKFLLGYKKRLKSLGLKLDELRIFEKLDNIRYVRDI
tara:strand:+ start:212 stop:736 length:525 start_codon:yes stop_codon:yes gene_type:complete